MSEPKETHRAWTRPQDYWPPRSPARFRRKSKPREEAGSRFDDPALPSPADVQRSTLVASLVMMIALAIMVVALAIAAWPSRDAAPGAPASRTPATAPPPST